MSEFSTDGSVLAGASAGNAIGVHIAINKIIWAVLITNTPELNNQVQR